MSRPIVAASRWPMDHGNRGIGLSGPPQNENGRFPLWPEQQYLVTGDATRADYVAYCREMGWEPNSEAMDRRPYYYFIATD